MTRILTPLFFFFALWALSNLPFAVDWGGLSVLMISGVCLLISAVSFVVGKSRSSEHATNIAVTDNIYSANIPKVFIAANLVLISFFLIFYYYTEPQISSIVTTQYSKDAQNELNSTTGTLGQSQNITYLVGVVLESQRNAEQLQSEWAQKNYVCVSPILCNKNSLSPFSNLPYGFESEIGETTIESSDLAPQDKNFLLAVREQIVLAQNYFLHKIITPDFNKSEEYYTYLTTNDNGKKLENLFSNSEHVSSLKQYYDAKMSILKPVYKTNESLKNNNAKNALNALQRFTLVSYILHILVGLLISMITIYVLNRRTFYPHKVLVAILLLVAIGAVIYFPAKTLITTPIIKANWSISYLN